jgi:glycosyltransferase involved in cell wall biosynthesis
MHSTTGEVPKSAELLFLYDPHISPGIRRYQEDLFTALCEAGYVPTLGYFESNPFTEQATFSYRLPLPGALARHRATVSLCKLVALDLLLPARFAMLFVPSQHAPIVRPLRERRKLIVTVHDIMPLIYGGLLKRTYYRFLLPRLMSCADAVVACSHHTRDDLLERFSSFNPDKIRVIPHGTPDSGNAYAPIYREKFVLAIYRNEPWKNSDLVVTAFQSADLPDYRLVNVGHAPAIKPTDPRIHFVGRVTDQELDRLYRSATCFVYPSLYEGFGFPILEAQARGCPVITSNHGVMRETAGDSARLFDVKDEGSLTRALQDVVHDRLMQADLREKGFANAARYTWDTAAGTYMSLFSELGA